MSQLPDACPGWRITYPCGCWLYRDGDVWLTQACREHVGEPPVTSANFRAGRWTDMSLGPEYER